MEDSAPRIGSTARALAALVVPALLVFGCASLSQMPPAQTEELLGRSGFERRPLSDPQVGPQAESLPVRKLVKATRADGSSRYVYKDPQGCDCVWVGSESAYADYRAMVVQANRAYAIDGSESSAPFASDDEQDWEAQEGLW